MWPIRGFLTRYGRQRPARGRVPRRRPQPGEPDQGGVQVERVGRRVDHGGTQPPGSPEEQRDAQQLLVEGEAMEDASVVEMLLAVVGGQGDQGVGRRHQGGDLPQEAVQLGVVVGEGAVVEPAQPPPVRFARLAAGTFDIVERVRAAVDRRGDAARPLRLERLRRVVGVVRVDGMDIEEGLLARTQRPQPGEGGPVRLGRIVVVGALLGDRVGVDLDFRGGVLEAAIGLIGRADVDVPREEAGAIAGLPDTSRPGSDRPRAPASSRRGRRRSGR